MEKILNSITIVISVLFFLFIKFGSGLPNSFLERCFKNRYFLIVFIVCVIFLAINAISYVLDIWEWLGEVL